MTPMFADDAPLLAIGSNLLLANVLKMYTGILKNSALKSPATSC